MSSKQQFSPLVDEALSQSLTALEQVHEASLRATAAIVGALPRPAPLLTPAEAVEAGFDFARDLLERQRSYTVRLTELVAGVDARAGA